MNLKRLKIRLNCVGCHLHAIRPLPPSRGHEEVWPFMVVRNEVIRLLAMLFERLKTRLSPLVQSRLSTSTSHTL